MAIIIQTASIEREGKRRVDILLLSPLDGACDENFGIGKTCHVDTIGKLGLFIVSRW